MRWNFRFLPSKEHEQALAELKILEEDVATAADFLRQNCQQYFQGKKKISIYLILGPSRFGKTTLLAQAGLDLIDANHQKLQQITPTKYCSFWFTEDALYIDTAGTYTKPDITKPRNDLIWQGFIKLLQKYFGKNSIRGTLIILDLPAVAADHHLLKRTLFCVRERVYEMSNLIKNLKMHLIFTKCDRILGFTEFFALLDQDERRQPFGISIASDQKTDLIATFNHQFNELINHLNCRIIASLQKSIHPEKRHLIKIFPSQMEHLHQLFIEVISKIPHSRQILLCGIYFTSSIQDGLPFDPIKTLFLYTLNLKEKLSYDLAASDDRSYFVGDLFKKIINLNKPPSPSLPNLRRLPVKYLYALTIAGSIIGTSSMIIYHSYQKNILALNQIQLIIQTKNSNNLDRLSTSMQYLEQNSHSWWLLLGMNQIKPLYRSLTKTYKNLSSQNLLFELESYLNGGSGNNEEEIDPQKLYRGLQVYLMFDKLEKSSQIHIQAWFDDFWLENGSSNEEQKNLRQQLSMICQHPLKIKLNQQVITTVRDYLHNLPPIQLLYLLLENPPTNYNLSNDLTLAVAPIYISKNFNKIYQDLIPDLVNNPPKHNEVLGELKLPLDPNDRHSIIKNLRELYLEKYLTTWETIAKLGPKIAWQDLTTASLDLSNMAKTNSKLIQTLEQLKANTTINNPPPTLTKEIQSRLQELHLIDLTEIQNNLNHLARYVSTIGQNPDINQTAFTTTVKYLQNQQQLRHPLDSFKAFTVSQPAWLQNYFHVIRNNLWQLLLNATRNHINQIWHQTVVPKYQATMMNKYPLFKESKEEISLEDFNNFFAPHGTIDSFFNYYIKPLVNTNKTDWSWKTIAEQKNSFAQTSLEIFLRAALIQKMFYSSKKLHPKIQFALSPIAITPNTQSFTIHIDGQKISTTNSSDDKKSYQLTWPGPQPGLVTINFINNQGRYFTTSEFGSWAWFKVLDKSNVTPIDNTKNFELTFDLNGNAAKYTLTTLDPVNPFIPDIINNFRCPDQLD